MIPASCENYPHALRSTIVLKLHLHLKEEKRQILILSLVTEPPQNLQKLLVWLRQSLCYLRLERLFDFFIRGGGRIC